MLLQGRRACSGVSPDRLTPNFSAIDPTADHSDPCSLRVSAAIRTAQSFNSAGCRFFDVLAMTPSFLTRGVSGHTGAIHLERTRDSVLKFSRCCLNLLASSGVYIL